MIGVAGYYEYIKGIRDGWDLNAKPNLKIENGKDLKNRREYMKEKVTAIVLAAGKGSRMHSKIQKQYMTLLDRPVITYALEAFEKSSVDEIILVVAPGEIEYAQKNILDKYDYKKVSGIITGGAERYDSVYKALCSMPEEGYVLIHDGARAFITPELIEFCIEQVKKTSPVLWECR